VKVNKVLIYHENNYKYPYIPQEDFYCSDKNIFVVTDGVTHDLLDGGLYPVPSDSLLVSKLTGDTLLNCLVTKEFVDDKHIREAFIEANTKVKEFNLKRELWVNRESNVYNYGSCVASLVIILENLVLYGVLDDCKVAVFDKPENNKIELKPYVDNSANYFNKKYDWSNPEHRKIWRKEIGNNSLRAEGNQEIGYGVIDGRDTFIDFLQIGSASIFQGDLVCVYTDGFDEPLKDKNFLNLLFASDFNMDLYEKISNYLRKEDLPKEKTAYFIKIGN
jgi:hypothetical protein